MITDFRPSQLNCFKENKNGTTRHTADATTNFLQETSDVRIISPNKVLNWPPNISEFTPSNYFHNKATTMAVCFKKKQPLQPKI